MTSSSGDDDDAALIAARRDVQAASAALVKCQAMAPLLPGIVERLGALHALHCAALDAAGALQRLESAQGETRALLSSNAELTRALTTSLQSNATTIGENIGAIQKRIDALNASKK